MKNSRTLTQILDGCIYDETFIGSDYFTRRSCIFNWEKLKRSLSGYYGLPFYENKFYSSISGFGSSELTDYHYVQNDCIKMILNYQLKEILKSCSKVETLNDKAIYDSQIYIDSFIDKIKRAYGFELLKWQLFPSSHVKFTDLVNTVYTKGGYDFEKEIILSKENLRRIVPVQKEYNKGQKSYAHENQSEYQSNKETHQSKGFSESMKDDFNQYELSELFDLLKKPLSKAKNSLLKISSGEKKFTTLQSRFVDAVSKTIEEVEKQEQFLKKNLVQDHLVIAFFGETNAGKSTIIDTFRILFNESSRLELIKNSNGEGTDGQIVGDGRCDFTQAYNEYNMMIDGKRFTLIDVPGIEGNEAEYKEGIRMALQKAHCIFYVHGADKKPNTKTTEKIKEYLNDWVSVYSICNIRGGSEDYEDEEDRETLMTERTKRSMELNQEVFKNTLGNHYLGNIPVQGLLALCSKANFAPSRKDLIGSQKDLEEYFGSPDAIYNFSHFQDVVESVRDMSLKYKELIIQSNKAKVGALAKRGIKDINNCITTEKDTIKDLSSKLSQFERNVYGATNKAKQRLTVRDIVEYELDRFRVKLYQAIDNSENEVENVARTQSKVMERNISSAVKNRCYETTSQLNEAINRYKRGLEADCNLTGTLFTNGSVNIKFDTDSITSEMKDFDFSGAFSAAMTAAGIATLIPGVGWILGGVIALGSALFGGLFGNDGRAEAKRKVDAKVDEVSESIINELNRSPLQVYKNNYTQRYNDIRRKVEKEKSNINSLQMNIEELKEDMKLTINYTK